jgi:hypothetical protein
MGADELNERYVRAHMKIVKECLRHTNETGYLSLKIDNDFYLVENSFEFISGDFDRDQFILHDISSINIPSGVRVTDAFYIYFSIRGANNITRLNIRKLILQVDKILLP